MSNQWTLPVNQAASHGYVERTRQHIRDQDRVREAVETLTPRERARLLDAFDPDLYLWDQYLGLRVSNRAWRLRAIRKGAPIAGWWCLGSSNGYGSRGPSSVWAVRPVYGGPVLIFATHRTPTQMARWMNESCRSWVQAQRQPQAVIAL